MKTYYIYTDGQAGEINAETLAEALAAWGAPRTVTTAESFAGWLRKNGGFGGIQEDGIEMVRVAA